MRQDLYARVRKSKAFMENNYAEQLDLERIAAAACMSKYHFVRTFRRAYGVTPRQYLREVRLSRARELLKKGVSVTQVCYEVGYESISTFSNAFKRGYGYSPQKYVKLNVSNPE